MAKEPHFGKHREMLLRRVQMALALVLLFSPFKVEAFKLNSRVSKYKAARK